MGSIKGMNKKVKDLEPFFGGGVNDDVGIIFPPLLTTFELPTREDLLRVKLGDHVKVMFWQKDRMMERMWVTVEDTDDPTAWYGTIDNDPICVDAVREEIVVFHPLTIIGYMKGKISNKRRMRRKH